MHNKLCIPARGNTKRTAHIRFAEMQADVCSTASGTARNSVIFNTFFLLGLGKIWCEYFALAEQSPGQRQPEPTPGPRLA